MDNEPQLRTIMRRAGIVVAILVCLVVVGAVWGGLALEYGVIHPLIRKMTTDGRRELAFVAGAASLVCVLDEYEQTIADDAEEFAGFYVYAMEAGDRCTSGITNFAQCYSEHRAAEGNPLTWANALAEAQRIMRTYERARIIVANAHAIVREMPTYDDKSIALKRELVLVTQTIRRLDIFDVLLDDMDATRAIDAHEEPFSAAVWDWTEDMVKRFPEAVILMEVSDAFSVIGLIAWRQVLTDPVVDEAMQASKTYRFARTRGCLMGSDPAFRAFEIVTAL